MQNRRITDGNYDKSIAVKCVNGTFVRDPVCQQAAGGRASLESTGRVRPG